MEVVADNGSISLILLQSFCLRVFADARSPINLRRELLSKMALEFDVLSSFFRCSDQFSFQLHAMQSSIID